MEIKYIYGIIIFIILICAFYQIYINFFNNPKKENFTHNKKVHYRCPNILIQKDKFIFLYNSRLAPVPGVNPIKFNNLNDYVEFTDWQRSQGIRCPVLFLQHSYDAQGNPVYKERPSPTDLQGGLPPTMPLDKSLPDQTLLIDAARNDPPYNKNQYPGYDGDNQYIGIDTPLDKLYNQDPDGVSPSAMDLNWGGSKLSKDYVDQINNNSVYETPDKKNKPPPKPSPNPMSPNWGGGQFTQDYIDKGVYADDNVSIYVPD